MTYGILGAGQLGRMLENAAAPLGLSVKVFTGDWKNPEELKPFLASCDRFVFENEFVPEESFKSLGVSLDDPRFFPPLSTMMLIQDKLEQKKLFERLELPTAPHQCEKKWTVEKLASAAADLPYGFVLKWSRLGYDGKGTWISPKDLNERAFEEALAFIARAEKLGVEVYLEEKAAFIQELAVVGCLSVSGEWKAYPVVITEQKNGICHQAYGPASRLGVDSVLCERIEEAAEKIARATGIVGVMALEVFQLDDETFWINEVAPRVHNSGHFSLDGEITSQFENHWRAIHGLPLGHIDASFLFLMRNILGEDRGASENRAERMAEASHTLATHRLHWYGKSEVRPGRKMGHINFYNLSREQLKQIRGME